LSAELFGNLPDDENDDDTDDAVPPNCPGKHQETTRLTRRPVLVSGWT
jgi:hypothetical protein